jgi:hypothetical protein
LITTFKDTVAVNHGTHLIKFGLQMNWEGPWVEGIHWQSWGRYNFNGSMTSQGSGVPGSDFADFLLGLPDSTRIVTSRPKIEARGFEAGFFLQDDWKVIPELTLNYGLRTQHYGTPTEANDLFYNFDFENSRVVVPDAAISQVVPVWPVEIPVVGNTEAGYPDSLVHFKTLVLDPRLGLAYKLRETTVLRGGYGIYHVPFARTGADITLFGPFSGWLGGRERGPFEGSETFTHNRIVNGVPKSTLAKPFPPVGSGIIAQQGVHAIPLHGRSDAWPYDQQWNLTLEQELGDGWAARISYVGSKGTHWPYRRNLQTPPPGPIPFKDRPDAYPWSEVYAFVDMHDLGGNSNYHGLELEATRQFSRGIYFRGWWEVRRNISDVDGGLMGSTSGSESEAPHDRSRDRGRQDFTPSERWRLSTVWDLPMGRGMRFGSDLPGWANHILGNWTAAFLLWGYNRQHYTPSYWGSDPSNTGRYRRRSDQSCDPNGFGDTPGQLWNPAYFSTPPKNAGRYGTATRGGLWGPRQWFTDFNLFKKWNLTGSEGGPYFKVEAFIHNIFNHCNDGPLHGSNTNIGWANFGVFSASTWDRRRPEIRLRLGF